MKKIVKHLVAIVLIFSIFINYTFEINYDRNSNQLVTVNDTDTHAFVLTSTAWLMLTVLAVGGATITSKWIKDNPDKVNKAMDTIVNGIQTTGGAVWDAVQTGLAQSGQNAYVTSKAMEDMAVEVRDWMYDRFTIGKNTSAAAALVIADQYDLISELNIDTYNPYIDYSVSRNMINSALFTSIAHLVQNNNFTYFYNYSTSGAGTVHYSNGIEPNFKLTFYSDTGAYYVGADLFNYSQNPAFHITKNGWTGFEFDLMPISMVTTSMPFLNNNSSSNILALKISVDDYLKLNLRNANYSTWSTFPAVVSPTIDYKAYNYNLFSYNYAFGNDIYIPFIVKDINGIESLVSGSYATDIYNKYNSLSHDLNVIYQPQSQSQIKERVNSITTTSGTIALPNEQQASNAINDAINAGAGSLVLDLDYLGNYDNTNVVVPPYIGDVEWPDFEFGDTTSPELTENVSGGLLGSLFGWLISMLTQPLVWLGNLIKLGFNSIFDLLSNLLTAVLEIPDILGNIWTAVMEIPNILGNIWTAVMEIPDILGNIWTAVLEIPQILSSIKDFIVDIPTTLSNIWNSVIGIPDMLENIWNAILAIPGHIANAWEWVISLPSIITNAVVLALEWVFVPDWDSIRADLDILVVNLVDRIPILYEIINLFTALIGGVGSAKPNFNVTFPSFLGGGTYSIFDTDNLDMFIPQMKSIISAFVWLFFLIRFVKKIPNFREG